MKALEQRLRQPPDRLDEFVHNVKDALIHLAGATSLAYEIDGYTVYCVGGDKARMLRPVRTALYIRDAALFQSEAESVCDVLASKGLVDGAYASRIDRVVYTAAQASYCYFDINAKQNANRRSAGDVFTKLIKNLFHAAGVDCQSLTFSLATKGERYNYPVDIVANKIKIESARNNLSPNDSLFCCMTTTKDRLSKAFAEKLLLDSYFNRPTRLGVIALHDVQRVKESGVSWTFSPNLFLLQWERLTPLSGLYYLDIPKTATGPMYHGKVLPLHELVLSLSARAQ